MTETRLANLLSLALLAGALGWIVIDRRPGSVLGLSYYAPIFAGVIGLFELALARGVAERVTGRVTSKPMHPLQVARAVVVAKTSSVVGALLGGAYVGLLVWLVPRHDDLGLADHDIVVSSVAVGTSLLLVVAALLLERACRTPDRPDR